MTDSKPKSAAEALGGSSDIVQEVPCRDCRKPVGITGMAWTLAKAANRYLADRGQKLLNQGELTRCDECRETYEAKIHQHAADRAARVADLRRRILDYPDAELIRQLNALDPCEETETFCARQLHKHSKGSSRRPPGEVS